jgi:hypothetical protein
LAIKLVNIIISKHEKKIKESDAAMRQEVIKDLEQVIALEPKFS